ncbi:MAG: hypothetical protein ABJP70_01195 [Erythrobacter sp.]|uniref:hypothetical protein n=1 Tax=Parasphingorhabdus sp. TaxID=2709688 RepID=UPI003271566B
MSGSAELEIYVQRYETFRHLDKMRYQAQSIAILVGTLYAGYLSGSDGDFVPAFGAVVGALLMSIAFTMWRISQGIVANSKVLAEYGEKVGDASLPIASTGWRTATFWTTILTFFVGFGLAGLSIYELLGA